MSKKIYRYEIGIPVSEYWIYEVDATSLKDALFKIRTNHLSSSQVYSIAAPTGKTLPKVFKKQALLK